MKKTLQQLAKELDFTNTQDYFNYVIESKINWNRKQYIDLLQDIKIYWHNKEYINFLQDINQEKQFYLDLILY